MEIISFLYGLITLGLILGFLGLCLWVYSPQRRTFFQKNADIPFQQEDLS